MTTTTTKPTSTSTPRSANTASSTRSVNHGTVKALLTLLRVIHVPYLAKPQALKLDAPRPGSPTKHSHPTILPDPVAPPSRCFHNAGKKRHAHTKSNRRRQSFPSILTTAISHSTLQLHINHHYKQPQSSIEASTCAIHDFLQIPPIPSQLPPPLPLTPPHPTTPLAHRCVSKPAPTASRTRSSATSGGRVKSRIVLRLL